MVSAVSSARSSGLNPPRPHGRGQASDSEKTNILLLKSTPPTRAGTAEIAGYVTSLELKSTPPTRAGTQERRTEIGKETA